MRYDLTFLELVKEVNEKISGLRKYSTDMNFRHDIMDILHIVSQIMSHVVMSKVYEYWENLG